LIHQIPAGRTGKARIRVEGSRRSGILTVRWALSPGFCRQGFPFEVRQLGHEPLEVVLDPTTTLLLPLRPVFRRGSAVYVPHARELRESGICRGYLDRLNLGHHLGPDCWNPRVSLHERLPGAPFPVLIVWHDRGFLIGIGDLPPS